MDEEQERADDLVRSWVSLPLSQRDAGPSAGSGSVARPDGLSVTTMLVRSVREDAREADWVASTAAVDSYDTIIQQDWDGEHKGLDRYRANPVVLFAHDSWALPIGRAKRVEVENAGTERAALVTTVKFATAKANPMAEFCWQSVLEQTLRGMSVGWRHGGIERREINGVTRTVFIRNTLYELSVCPVPSNPDALMRTAQRAFGQRAWSLPSAPEQRSTPPGPDGRGSTPQIPAAVAAPKQEKKAMALKRTLIIDKLVLAALVRDHAADVQDGEDTVRVSIPGLVEIDMAKRTAEERATKAEGRVAELERDVSAANKRATDAEAAATKAKEEQAKAEKERAAAIAERATVELDPLTGDESWQITPAQRDHYARLAGSDPEAYKNLVAEVRSKGEKAGALSRTLPRAHLPTRQGDPSPRTSAAKPGTRSDDDLFAEAERAVDQQRAGASGSGAADD